MKNQTQKLLILALISFATFLTSCSGDDDSTTNGCDPLDWYQDLDGDGLGNPNVVISDCTQPTGYVSNSDDLDDTTFYTPPTYMPQNSGNYWTYKTERTDPQTTTQTQGRDSLYVATTSTINNLVYTDLDATTTSTGFMTTFLAQNFIRTDNQKSHIQGTFDLDLTVIGGNTHTINLNDAVFLDANASVNSTLHTNSGNITDPVTINGQNVTLIIDYTIKMIQKESLPSYMVDGVSFNQVLKSNIIINAKVDAQVSVGGFPVTLNVAPTQDINIIENYYAENIGLIQSDSNLNINLDATVAGQLGIPTNINSPSNQKIDTYVVN